MWTLDSCLQQPFLIIDTISSLVNCSFMWCEKEIYKNQLKRYPNRIEVEISYRCSGARQNRVLNLIQIAMHVLKLTHLFLQDFMFSFSISKCMWGIFKIFTHFPQPSTGLKSETSLIWSMTHFPFFHTRIPLSNESRENFCLVLLATWKQNLEKNACTYAATIPW